MFNLCLTMATSSLKIIPKKHLDFLDTIRPVLIFYNVMGLNHYYIKAKHGYVTPDMTEANLKLSRLAPNKFLAVFCFIIIAVLWIFTILGLHASKNKLDNLPMIMEGIQTLGNVLVIIITAIFFWKDGHLLIEIIKALVILDNDYSLLSQEEYQSLKRKQLRFILMQIFLMLFCAISGIIMSWG